MSSFKAYIDVDEYDSQDYAGNDHDSFDARSGLKLLPGEVVVSSAYSVLKYAPLSSSQGISGAIFVTNFKLGFVTADQSSYELVDRSPRNHFLGECDVSLANIDSVYQVLESNGRKKKLLPGSNVSGRVELLQVHCKNFRVQTFSFKFSPLGQEKAVINAILHHAFPPRIQLLFAFEYKGSTNIDLGGTKLFNIASDWMQELRRLQAEKRWRVTHLNENCMISKSLPEVFVVPGSVLDKELNQASPHFNGNRLPTWSWSRPDGCAIVRSAGIHPGVTENYQMELMLDYIEHTHPRNLKPNIVDLDSLLPPLKDIQQSYVKLRELCMPDTANQFWEQDNHYFTLLDNTKWLHNVATCLDLSKNLAAYINHTKKIVILQEAAGRDLSCLISSLMQLILDPHYRTIVGFQSLIQKEWIAMGHPFSDRLKLVRSTENEQCPVFLVFLDCVWQMLQQFPSTFEFSEFYLTILWDSMHFAVFDTFLFNSCWDRFRSCKDRSSSSRLLSLWDWTQLYNKDDMLLFHNPLFIVSQTALKTLNSEQYSSLLASHNYNVHSYQSSKTVPRTGSEYSIKPWQQTDANITPGSQNNSKENSATVLRTSTSSLHAPDILTSSFSKLKMSNVLSVNTHSFVLQMWNHCYLRWVPPAQIYGGGSPAIYLQRCNLVKDIMHLERRLGALANNQPFRSTNDHVDSLIEDASQLQLRCGEGVTSSFPYSSGGSPTVFGLPLSFYRHSKYVASDDELNSEDFTSYDE